eukprot:252029_1
MSVSVGSAPKRINAESWLEVQDPDSKAVWTRDWVVCTGTAIYICKNYKCYKDLKKIISGADVLSILDSELPGHQLGIKTNKETTILRFIGYLSKNNWKYSLDKLIECVNIPVSVECKKEKRYNCNFPLPISYSSCRLTDIIDDITFQLESKFDTKKFVAQKIDSASYCGKIIDCNSSQFKKKCDEFAPNIFSKEDVMNKGIILSVDSTDIEAKQAEQIYKRVKKKMGEKKAEKLQWLIENQHNEILWDKMKTNLNEHYSEQSELRWIWRDENDYNTTLQTKYLKENENRTNELSQNEPLSVKLFKILNECKLIKTNGIHEEIVKLIIIFDIGGSVMPIYYTLSYLPFFQPTSYGKLDEYFNTLKVWWNEVRCAPNHWGVFQPINMKSAATEFAQFLDTRLLKNSSDLKYYLVPVMKMDKIFNIWTGEHLSFELGKQNAKCLGGIELFQRLYLEAAVEGLFGFGRPFVLDLQTISETHGDNWCFDGNGCVLMANNKYKKICELKVGDKVRSFPNFVSTIICCIESNINDKIEMVKLQNDCWITFEHPVLINNCEYNGTYDGLNGLNTDEIKQYGLLWVLPKVIRLPQLRYQDKIYNFLLDSHHTINVNGNWCCTLGHDYTGEVIYHPFWGNSNVVKSFLKSKSNTYPNVVF